MMGSEIHLPTLGLIIGSAAIDSINPCAIGVLILMISVMMAGNKSLGRMLLLGGLYIFAIFLTYLFTFIVSSTILNIDGKSAITCLIIVLSSNLGFLSAMDNALEAAVIINNFV